MYDVHKHLRYSVSCWCQ